MQGARQVREHPEAVDVRFIFLLPPSLSVLEERLRGRGTDSDEVIDKRLALVDRELEAAELFDYAVVNDDLDLAVDQVLSIIEAERSGRTEAVRARFGRGQVLTNWLRMADSVD